MSKASLRLPSFSLTSKVDDRNWTREVWLAAYRQSRAQIREGGRYGLGARYVHCLGHLRRRFGATGWKIAQAAARVAFDRRTVAYAASGSVADLERQGWVRRTARPRRGNLLGVVAYRGVTLERVRACGLDLLWAYDPLASAPST